MDNQTIQLGNTLIEYKDGKIHIQTVTDEIVLNEKLTFKTLPNEVNPDFKAFIESTCTKVTEDFVSSQSLSLFTCQSEGLEFEVQVHPDPTLFTNIFIEPIINPKELTSLPEDWEGVKEALELWDKVEKAHDTFGFKWEIEFGKTAPFYTMEQTLIFSFFTSSDSEEWSTDGFKELLRTVHTYNLKATEIVNRYA